MTAEPGKTIADWRPVSEWKLGTSCLICCRGANPSPGFRGEVSQHYGAASLPAGTVAWALLPDPPPLPQMTLDEFSRRLDLPINGRE